MTKPEPKLRKLYSPQALASPLASRHSVFILALPWVSKTLIAFAVISNEEEDDSELPIMNTEEQEEQDGISVRSSRAQQTQ